MGLQEDLNEWSPTTILPCMYMLQLVIDKKTIIKFHLIILFPVESHVSDLNSIKASDTPQMRANKERVFELVQQWLEI